MQDEQWEARKRLLVSTLKSELGIQVPTSAQARLLRVLQWVVGSLKDQSTAELSVEHTNAILAVLKYGPPAAALIAQRTAATVDAIQTRGVIVQAQLKAMRKRDDPDDENLLDFIVCELRRRLCEADERFRDLPKDMMVQDLDGANLDDSTQKPSAPGSTRIAARWACKVGALGAIPGKGKKEEDRVWRKVRQALDDAKDITSVIPSPYEDMDVLDAELEAISKKSKGHSQ